jgi:hypothetical protein
MSDWYFEFGGLLLSTDARNAYFRLSRALLRGSIAGELRMPSLPEDAEHISVEKLKGYRSTLAIEHDLDDVEAWKFGDAQPDAQIPHRFRDFIFLQRLSSELRTSLAYDLRSRRRPS